MLGKLLLLSTLSLGWARPDGSPSGRSFWEASELCRGVGHHLLAHEWDCTKFYYCEYGMKYIEPASCAPGTEFSFDLQVCTHPVLVNCQLPGVPPTTPETETPTTESPTTLEPETEPPTTPTEPPTTPTEPPTTPTEPPTTPTEPPTTPTEPPTTPTKPPTTPTDPPTEPPTTPTDPPATPTEPPTTPTDPPSTPTDPPTTPTPPTDPPATPTEPPTTPTEPPTTPTEPPTTPTEPPTTPTEPPTTPTEPTTTPTEPPTTPTEPLTTPTDPPTTPTDPPTTTTLEPVTEPATDPPTPAPTAPPVLANGCPADIHIHQLLPHEECNKFYYCDKGEKVERQCAPGTYFNYDEQVCDHPENVNCANEDKDENASGTVNGTLPGCPADWSIHQLLPHETDCAKFYYCVYGEKVERDCGPGTHFNPVLQVCDWPWAAGCINSNSTTTDSPSTGAPITETDVPITVTDAPITEATAVTTPEEPELLPNGCPADWSIHQLLPHETDCTKFYYCVYGEKVERDCAPGTHFNPVLQVCDWPWAAGCINSNSTTTQSPNTDAPSTVTDAPITDAPTTVTTAPEEPELLPNGCPADWSIHHLLPHETDCTKFYYCVYGEKVERDCGPGTHFNPVLQVCDWPWAAGCINSNSTTTESPNTDAPSTETDAPITVTDAPVTDAPSTETDAPITVTDAPITEAPSTEPNVNITVTDAPITDAPSTEPNVNITVTDTPITDAPTTVTTAPEEPELLPNGCPADWSIHQLLPHETDCTKFYYCVYGEKVERDCGPGTHFNPVLQVCDWPWAAGCINSNSTTTQTPNTDAPSTETEAPITDAPSTETEAPITDAPSTVTDVPITDAPSTEAPNKCIDSCNVLPWAHEQDCDKFWQCDGTTLILSVCAEGLHFNPSTHTCDFICNAGCRREQPQTTYGSEGVNIFLPWNKVQGEMKSLVELSSHFEKH